mgnify:CR=1 FL=1
MSLQGYSPVERKVMPIFTFLFCAMFTFTGYPNGVITCLLYTSDAADDLLCVDLGGRRIIKKKKEKIMNSRKPLQHLI